MKRIDEDIKNGQFQNLYLIYGEEEYLKRQYKKKLIDALVNPDDNMNFSKYEGSSVSIPQVIDQAETMPFLSDYRVILLEDCGFGKKANDELNEYLKNIAESTIFIIVEPEVDRRGKLYKTAKALNRDIEIKIPDERGLAMWIGSKLKDAGIQMKKDAWSEFFNRTNGSMDNMDRELEKLISYVGDSKQITIEDVKEICIAQVETKIFDMINAIAAKNIALTLDLYHDMLSAKEPPMRILYMIVKQFRQMKIIKELASHGENDGSIARKIGTYDFAVRKLRQLSSNFSNADIDSLLSDSASFEQKVKTGLMDENMAVELIMMKYAKA